MHFLKAVILAAGLNTRFGNLGNLIPKCLLPIGNTPIIKKLLISLQELDINDILIVLGHFPEKILTYLKKQDDLKINISFKTSKNYSKGPIYSFLDGFNWNDEDNFLLLPSDLFVSKKLIKKLIENKKKGEILIAINKNLKSGGGIPIYLQSIVGNQLVGVVSGLNNPIKKYDLKATCMPLLIGINQLWDYAKKSAQIGHTKVIDSINYMIKDNLAVKYFDGSDFFCFDIDNKDKLIQANNYTLENQLFDQDQIYIPPDTVIKKFNNLEKISLGSNSKIIGPCLFGKSIQVKNNSIIGPFTSMLDYSE